MVWIDKAWHGKAWHGHNSIPYGKRHGMARHRHGARQCMAWQGKARQGMAWQGMQRQGMAWHGMARQGKWQGMAWQGNAWHGKARHGKAWHGMAWHGMAWQAMARQGMAWQGKAWHGMARQGMETQDLPSISILVSLTSRVQLSSFSLGIHLDTFYYISVIIFIPLGLDVLNILGLLCSMAMMS
jgi:hypothetical protein